MSTHNKGFYEDLTKIIFELSSNTHLISSAGSRNWNCLSKSLPVCAVDHTVTAKSDLLFLFRLNVTFNNFSVMSGRSHSFLGITRTFGD